MSSRRPAYRKPDRRRVRPARPSTFQFAPPPASLVFPGYTRTGGFYAAAAASRAAPANELKFFDTNVDNATMAATGEVFPSVNLVAQGTGESQRIGRKLVIKSIDWKYTVSLPGGGAAADTVRIIIFVDKQCNGSAATVAEILASTDYQSFNNLSNKGRFLTLCDKTFTLNRNAGQLSSSYPEVRMDGTWHKTLNLPIEFDSTTGAITEIRSNNIGVLQIDATSQAKLDSVVRIRYVD